MSLAATPWPRLDETDWSETRAALHLYLQIVGKYRLARTPWLNHSWHAVFRVTARGLATTLIGDSSLAVEAEFDFAADRLAIEVAGGDREAIALEPMSVAGFHARFREALRRLGANDQFHGAPNEIADGVPFKRDDAPRPYDADAVRRFHRALVSATLVFEQYRTGFIGKSSPAHLFWGSFDLAVTRFSGRLAPLHPGGIPALPDEVTREAYSHELASAGFWPGGGPVEEAAFYAYAYPEPEGFPATDLAVDGAFYHGGAGEFVLPYDTVRQAPDPDAALLSFLTRTFEAAARLGEWDYDRLACPIGRPLEPRPLEKDHPSG